MDDFNKPNVVLPMASSYNERGREGYTQSITNARDQRKVNCFYEVNVNAGTGDKSLVLTKRPAPLATDSAFSISSDSVIYLLITDPSNTGVVWAAAKGSARVEVADDVGSRGTVVGSADNPVYFDRTTISGTQYGVLQTHDGNGAYRTWFATTIASWSQISASGFTGLQHVGKMEHIDGFALQMTRGGRIQASGVNTLVTWDANHFIAKNIEQDVGRGLARLGTIILGFGRETVEGFYNAGNAGNPLGRIPHLSQRIGVLVDPMESTTPAPTPGMTHYYCTIGKSIYFLGNEARSLAGSNIGVFSFNGERFEKVSTTYIDKILLDVSFVSTGVKGVHTVTVYGNQAVAVMLTGPSVTPAIWLMFFPHLNEWFEWNSTTFTPISGGDVLAGIGGTAFSRDYFRYQDVSGANLWVDGSAAGLSYDMIHQFKLPKNNNARSSMAWGGVVADSQSAGASASAGAYLQMSFSDNDSESFGTPIRLDLRTRRKQAYRLGSYEERHVRLVHSGNAECRIQQFIAKTL